MMRCQDGSIASKKETTGECETENKFCSGEGLFGKAFNNNYRTVLLKTIKINPITQKDVKLFAD